MDKKASDIVGLPVVTFERGTKLYEVEDLLLDPERRQVLALLVSEKALFRPALAVPFGRIKVIGPDAVIVQDGKAAIEVEPEPVLRALYRDNINVREWRVLTEGGRKLGNVTDMLIDSYSGEIKGFNVSTGGVPRPDEMRWLPMDQVVSMGRLVLYVSDNYVAEFESQRGGWLGALVLDKQTTRDVAGEGDEPIARAGETVTSEMVDAARKADKLPELLAAVGEEPGRSTLRAVRSGWERVREESGGLLRGLTGAFSSVVGKTDERIETARIRNALGRPVNRVILDPDDNVILDTGDIITHRAVETARQVGVLDVLLSSVYTDRPKLDLTKLRYRDEEPAPREAKGRKTKDGNSRARLSSPAGMAASKDGERAAESAEDGREELADRNEASRAGGYGPVSDS